MAINTAREDETVREGSKKDTLLRLYCYLLSYKKELIEIMLLLLITLAVTLGSPLLIEYAVDTCVANSDVPGLLRLAVIALLAYIVYLVCTRRWMVKMEDITNCILLTIRGSLYEHLQMLSLRFFDSRPTGKILSRVVGDVNSLKEVLSDSVTKLFPDLLTLIGVAVIMLVKNWMLAMAALVMLPVLFGCMFAIQTVEHKRWQIHRKKSSNLNALIHESISGIRLIQSFDAEREKQEEFDSSATEFSDSWIAAVRIGDLFGPFVEIAWGAGSFLLYFIGLRVVGGDRIGVGTFIAFSTYLGMFWNPIRNLASFYNKIVTNISAAERIFDILDTPADITDHDGVKELPPVQGEVSFENVSFAYADAMEKPVLSNVSFTVKPGERIALVGPTGAGKTTIVNLICRFYDVVSGCVKIDGQDIRDVKLKSLRSQVGMMTQDTFLFTGTIRENLCYGRQSDLPGETGSAKEVSDEEMIAAAKAVNAHDFIMALENGYDTVISERGGQLSVGQRQLLAFARTMIANPRILILDEATSSIDTHTERLVQSGIETMLRGRTSFTIAHRLSTIRNADRIFYVDGNHILEAGSHEELMAKKGYYWRLYQSQYEGECA
ncbi:MAG: ABC transporter ATP-binding protein/permease [Lachnospiraceae bacterium]|nr:ABC transporter ATP-binding protein/permease [Lachnospiraceae bacterium]